MLGLDLSGRYRIGRDNRSPSNEALQTMATGISETTKSISESSTVSQV